MAGRGCALPCGHGSDGLSEGRLDFGIGVGWNKEEVEACGYRWENRGARCDEFLEVIRRLWTEPVVDFEGKGAPKHLPHQTGHHHRRG
jgi:alkanesulfonate monooxygenase SsuD/methylene tetrahydromethanopterin reductase-like flavin-dependent oxidoreductase (luciferase family)